MILPFCLSRLTEIEKRLTIKCGDSMCRPKVYDEFIRYTEKIIGGLDMTY